MTHGWINLLFTKTEINRWPNQWSRYRETEQVAHSYCQSQQQNPHYLSLDSKPERVLLMPDLLVSQTLKMRIKSLCQWPNNWMSNTRTSAHLLCHSWLLDAATCTLLAWALGHRLICCREEWRTKKNTYVTPLSSLANPSIVSCCRSHDSPRVIKATASY